MKIAILGAGALGCYYGARLVEAGEDVTFILRSAYEPVREKGLQINSVSGDVYLPQPQIARTPEECGPVDLVIVCWKSTCNDKLPTALPPLLHERTRVVTFQNGMGNAEAISEIVPVERVFVGLCFVCAMMDTPGVVNHLNGEDIHFAPAKASDEGLAQAEEFAALFTRARIPSTAFRDAERILWCKLSWNIPFNGLCVALGGIDVQQLFTMPEQVERARDIIQEICDTAERRGYPLPMEIVQHQIDRTSLMGPFVPSSAVDYNRHRPVEYDAIWGRTLLLARDVHAPVPQWERLAADIRARLAERYPDFRPLS